MATANEQLLALEHEIRQIEHALAVARSRRRWSNLSLVFGPLLGVLLYSMLWIHAIPRAIIVAIYIPAAPIAAGFCIASFRLKSRPGFREKKGQPWLSEGELELKLANKREDRKYMLARSDVPIKLRRLSYREDARTNIDQFRIESRGYRRVNNILQGIVIIGSLAATGTSGLAAALANVRWATLGITFLVGISSGFMGYFKYKERSFYLQQTADAIEGEREAFDVGVGRYKKCANEEEALAEFVDEVHRLKSEQKRREQSLEQPPESRNSNE